MQKFSKNIITFITAAIITFSVILLSWINLANPLLADTNTAATNTATTNTASPAKPAAIELTSPIEAKSVPELIGTIIKTILGFVGALALLMFIYGGFTWLTSGGSPDRIKKGKDILIWATIGLAVIFASYTLVDFVIRAITGAE